MYNSFLLYGWTFDYMYSVITRKDRDVHISEIDGALPIRLFSMVARACKFEIIPSCAQRNHMSKLNALSVVEISRMWLSRFRNYVLSRFVPFFWDILYLGSGCCYACLTFSSDPSLPTTLTNKHCCFCPSTLKIVTLNMLNLLRII